MTASFESFEEFPRDLVEITTEALMVSANTVITVSYTHLDVYKRQGVLWSRSSRADFGLLRQLAVRSIPYTDQSIIDAYLL